MSKVRKTVFFIVEGSSEQVALAAPLSTCFADSDVRFHVVHGDVTSDWHSTPTNIITRLHEMVRNEMAIYHLKKGDVLAVFHLVDTDGVYVSDEVVQYGEVSSASYLDDAILTRNPAALRNRNSQKRGILARLIRCHEIGGMPYRVYFMSCNLDHVIGGERNASLRQKESFAESFAFMYADDKEAFISFLKAAHPPVISYKDSWEFIGTDLNSLARYSNLLQAITSLSGEGESLADAPSR